MPVSDDWYTRVRTHDLEIERQGHYTITLWYHFNFLEAFESVIALLLHLKNVHHRGD